MSRTFGRQTKKRTLFLAKKWRCFRYHSPYQPKDERRSESFSELQAKEPTGVTSLYYNGGNKKEEEAEIRLSN